MPGDKCMCSNYHDLNNNTSLALFNRLQVTRSDNVCKKIIKPRVGTLSCMTLSLKSATVIPRFTVHFGERKIARHVGGNDKLRYN